MPKRIPDTSVTTGRPLHRCDLRPARQTDWNKTKDQYPELLRRIRYRDPQRDKNLVFLTNNMELAPLTIAELYRSRWQVELFFKWTKQHLRIKPFYGNSENAVKSQLWIAISVYVLCTIIRKKSQLEFSLYTIMQVFSLTLFKRIRLNQILTDTEYTSEMDDFPIQLKLSEKTLGH